MSVAQRPASASSEAETETGAGRIGIWDASDGLRRIGMLDSGGTGPHECILLPGGRLAVANGAIENGADGKPDPLDLAEMQPNLTYIDLAAGTILQRLHLDGALRQNSIRHLAVRPDGLLAFAMQWHGDPTAKPALLGLHREGEAAPRLLAAPDALQAAMQGYAGSIAFSGDGQQVAISSPLGGLIDAGLAITMFREHDVLPWQGLPILVPASERMWRLPEGYPRIPLSYSLRAKKAA